MAQALEQGLAENPQALNRPVIEARVRHLKTLHVQAEADEREYRLRVSR